MLACSPPDSGDTPRVTAATDVHPAPAAREQIATRAAFFVAGFAMASWAPLVPLAKARIGLHDGQLGGLLLCLGVGSVLAMPFSGALAARYGCRRVILAAGALALTALPFMASAPTSITLATALLAFGAGVGVVDSTINVQAVIVERASGKAMMSGFHGLFSVGGLVGAGGTTALLALGLPPIVAVTLLAALSALLLVAFARGLLPYGGEAGPSPFILPRGRVLLIGGLCGVLFLAEGSVLDWGGMLLHEARGLDNARSGIGYAAFAATMTAGRLAGDGIVRSLGPTRVLLLGASVAAAGFALAALAPAWPLSVLGFALVGVGASNAVPVLFSAAGRQTSMPSGLAIASVTTIGYTGILAGPALIGFVARGLSLPVALLGVAVLLMGVALGARRATSE